MIISDIKLFNKIFTAVRQRRIAFQALKQEQYWSWELGKTKKTTSGTFIR